MQDLKAWSWYRLLTVQPLTQVFKTRIAVYFGTRKKAGARELKSISRISISKRGPRMHNIRFRKMGMISSELYRAVRKENTRENQWKWVLKYHGSNSCSQAWIVLSSWNMDWVVRSQNMYWMFSVGTWIGTWIEWQSKGKGKALKKEKAMTSKKRQEKRKAKE